MLSAMERVDLLRRQIALYRRYLREGVSAPQAELYLRQISRDETELRALANDGSNPGGEQYRPRFSPAVRPPPTRTEPQD